MFFNFKTITNKITQFTLTNFNNKTAQFFSVLIGLFCAAILFGSLFVEYILKIQPCILCTIQRTMFLLILITCIAYSIINSLNNLSSNTSQTNNKHLRNKSPKPRFLDWIFLCMVALFALLGAMVAGRQSWLQMHANFNIPSCSSGLLEMLQEHSIINIIYMAIKGKLECTVIGLKIFGLSLANWGLINFVGILLLESLVIYKILLKSQNSQNNH